MKKLVTAAAMACMVISGCDGESNGEGGVSEAQQAATIDRANMGLTLRFGHATGKEVEHVVPETIGDNVVVGFKLRGYRIENGDLDYVVLVLLSKNINDLGADPVESPDFGAGGGTLQWEREFIAPPHYVVVGAGSQMRRLEEGDRDVLNLDLLIAQGVQGQRSWSPWIGPEIGQVENYPTPQSQEVPIGSVVVGMDMWRFRQDDGDRDLYEFGLRYGEVMP